jgi:hypothetical protein
MHKTSLFFCWFRHTFFSTGATAGSNSTGLWIQGLVLARQLLHHLSQPSPFYFRCFSSRSHLEIIPRLAWTTVLLFTPPMLLGWQACTSTSSQAHVLMYDFDGVCLNSFNFFFFFCSTGNWTQDLCSTTSAMSPVLFLLVCFSDRNSWWLCPGWPWTLILGVQLGATTPSLFLR